MTVDWTCPPAVAGSYGPMRSIPSVQSGDRGRTKGRFSCESLQMGIQSSQPSPGAMNAAPVLVRAASPQRYQHPPSCVARRGLGDWDTYWPAQGGLSSLRVCSLGDVSCARRRARSTRHMTVGDPSPTSGQTGNVYPGRRQEICGVDPPGEGGG